MYNLRKLRIDATMLMITGKGVKISSPMYDDIIG